VVAGEGVQLYALTVASPGDEEASLLFRRAVFYQLPFRGLLPIEDRLGLKTFFFHVR
jgi:hypothetical protein